MPTKPTVREVQEAIITLHRFADQDDTLCRGHLKSLVRAMADVLSTILVARDWVPVDSENKEIKEAK